MEKFSFTPVFLNFMEKFYLYTPYTKKIKRLTTKEALRLVKTRPGGGNAKIINAITAFEHAIRIEARVQNKDISEVFLFDIPIEELPPEFLVRSKNVTGKL